MVNMFMIRRIILFVALYCLNLAESVAVRSCSNGVPPPAIVSIERCSEMPCDLVRGTNTTMTMVYEAPFDVLTLKYDRLLTTLGITAPIPMGPERGKGCDWLLGSSCPFRQGELIISTFTSVTLPIYPLVSGTIEFFVYDEQDRMLTCFLYDIRIVTVVEVRSCSNGVPPPAIVSIEGCSEMPCNFIRGANTTMTMVYEAPFDVEILTYHRIVTSLGITASLPWKPERDQGCKWLIGTSCPIRKGELVISTHTSYPLPIYPLVSATIEFSIHDELDRILTCFVYDIQITVVG
uniref:MD-2-related lipid-recognition domain-containing protein n=1 Tax=Anopheles epiroticus TaxID=199890 RepID=A0A182PQI6_9DIPT